MILDHLVNWPRYGSLHPGFAAAFAFLERDDLGELPSGRCEIDGDRLYAVVVREDGRGRDAAKLEAHRAAIDIQFAVSGTDEIGWKSATHCEEDSDGYDLSRDLELFPDVPVAWVATAPGMFAIFLPSDAHAPLGGTGPIHKVVVKVAQAW